MRREILYLKTVTNWRIWLETKSNYIFFYGDTNFSYQPRVTGLMIIDRVSIDWCCLLFSFTQKFFFNVFISCIEKVQWKLPMHGFVEMWLEFVSKSKICVCMNEKKWDIVQMNLRRWQRWQRRRRQIWCQSHFMLII